MIIGSITENIKFEKRVSLVPDIIKKYTNLGFEVQITKGYGDHIGFSDDLFIKAGAKIANSKQDVLKNSNILIQLDLIEESVFINLKKDSILVGSLNSSKNKNKIEKLKSNGVNIFLELLPRITRAQSMDILSSQANLAGYKAVIDAFSYFEKAIPMMMTAAGTVSAAKVLIVGASCWPTSSSNCKRMGAGFCNRCKNGFKKQVESLGGKFLIVEGTENLETKGGYAKEASEDFKKKQEQLLSETLKKIDIVICTALIPGKKAPIIIKDEMIKGMQPGSVIYDLAAIQGGNTAFTEVDQIIDIKWS